MRAHVLPSLFILLFFSFGWMAAGFFAVRKDLKKNKPSPFCEGLKKLQKNTSWVFYGTAVFSLMAMATGGFMSWWILSTYRSGPIMLFMAGLPVGGAMLGISLAFLGDR